MFEFLKEIKNEDLKNWVNAVADQSDDGCIQETTLVTSLEEIRRELRPLLSLEQPDIAQLLVELIGILERNAHAASKLRLCHENVSSLRQIHSNISHRGEVTKERIVNAVRRGLCVIDFNGGNGCDAHLKYYTRNGAEVSCSFPDLLDLRGRGLLLVDSAAKFGELPSTSATIQEDETFVMPYVKDFVLLVDHLGEVLVVGTQLGGLGHFNYQARTIEVQSSGNMSKLLNNLKRE
ncbi:hypothetical protein BC938DRAFT_475060, partial [Jimgerdemannia flammicorona]